MEKYCPSNKPYFVTEHWHEDLEFLYVIDGELEYCVNGKTLFLHSGEGIFVNSKRMHSNRTIPNKSCAYYCSILHPDIIPVSRYIEQKYYGNILGPNSFDYLLLTRNDWTSQIIDTILYVFEEVDAKNIELETIEGIMKIFRLIYNHLDAQTISPSADVSPDINAFKPMIVFIQEHYMEKISLDEIANAGNVGRTLCAKLFKKYVSKTPGDYLIYYRIHKSCELLRKTSQSVTNISFSTGFSSTSHFSKTFREIMGCTPLQYRSDHPVEHHVI